uniref:PAS domain-containing protein n=1 Tax=Anopheles farauti TaxID=69004 RepID=A0A182QVV3_9DIPT
MSCVEDLLIHGDSVYDIIDKQDHGAIQSELSRGVSQHTSSHHHHLHQHHHHQHHQHLHHPHSQQQQQQLGSNHHNHHGHHHHHLLHHGSSLSPSGSSVASAGGGGGPAGSSAGSSLLDGEQRIFLCRMNVSRNARRQMRFGDQKVVLVQGHYLSYLPLCSRNEPVFIATCTPIAMPETRECVVQGATNVFTTIHSMDMKVVHIDKNGEFHLGYSRSELQGVSWYQLLHWESTREAQSKHRLITQSEQDRSCILLVRMQRRQSDFLWVHVVLQVRDGQDSNQQSVIVCTNQVLRPPGHIHRATNRSSKQYHRSIVRPDRRSIEFGIREALAGGPFDRACEREQSMLSDREASVMLSNSWLYHYYTVQSKMQFGIPFEGATRIPPTAPYYSSGATPGHHNNHSPGGGGGSGVSAGGAGAGAMSGGTSGGTLTATGLQTHGYATPHHHLPAYGYHSPSGQHHNGGSATPMLHGHQHQQQQLVNNGGLSTSDEYGTRPYGFRLDSTGQPVDYSGGHPTPPTSAPPVMANPVAVPIPVVHVTPHIRCHNGGGGGNASNSEGTGNGTSNSHQAAGNANVDRHNGTPPAKKRNINRLEPIYIPENGQSESSDSSAIELQGASSTIHHAHDNGGAGVGNGMNNLSSSSIDGSSSLGNGGGTLTSNSSGGTGGGGGGGGLQTMVQLGNRATIGRLHPKSAMLPTTVSNLSSEPTDFMEQWNPSPPWSDTTAQKVPDISHQELSPYMTTTPPTPTSAPHQHHNGGFPTATTFSFDWMPEQFVPIATDCTGTLVPAGVVQSVQSGTPTIACLSTNSAHGSAAGNVGCVLPPNCLTQDGLPIPGLTIPMPVPLPIPPPPWPSDHRLLALEGTSGPSTTSSATGESANERKPLDESRGGHDHHQDQRRSQ